MGQRIHKRVGAPEPAAGLSWPKALRAVQAWLIPWSVLARYWRSWSPAPEGCAKSDVACELRVRVRGSVW